MTNLIIQILLSPELRGCAIFKILAAEYSIIQWPDTQAERDDMFDQMYSVESTDRHLVREYSADI